MIGSIDVSRWPTVMALGALVFMFVRHAYSAWLDRGRTHFPWLAIIGLGLAFTVARLGELGDPDLDHVLIFIRAQYAAALLLPGFGCATVEVVAELPTSRTTFAMIAVTVVLAFACVATPWFVLPPVVTHTDAFGNDYHGAQPSTLVVAAAIPLIAWLGIAVRRRIRRMPPSLATLRRAFRITAAVFVALAINDTLLGAGVVPTIHAFELAFVVFGLVASGFERRRTLAQLVDSRARYRHLANATREGVLLCDGDLVLDTNRAMRDLLELRDGQAAPRVVADLVDRADRADRDNLARLLHGDDGPVEVMLRVAGRRVATSIKATSVSDGDAGTRVLLVRDVSGERELQLRLMRADRLAAIGTLAAGAAHEINNPLTFVGGNVELLRAELERARAAIPPDLFATAIEMLADMELGADRIGRIVRDLMKLARERPSDESAVDVRDTLDATLAMASSQLRFRARVVKHYGDVSPVFASEGRLFQVFLNLIVNAAQAIPEGDREANEVRVRTSQASDRVVVEITDTGCGMPATVRDRIFDPFFTTKDVGQGTGLGLSISLGIVTSIGGSIDVTSDPERGTTVRVELPAMAQPAAPVAAPVAPAQATAEATAIAMQVLIVDDEPLLAKALSRLLRGHDVDVAHDGRDGLERLSSRRYDVVLCDLMMPGVTGMELHATLVARGDDIVERFIFITGGALDDRSRAFLDRVRWMPKPIAKDALLAEIAEVARLPRRDRR